jgi:hypothetical protein
MKFKTLPVLLTIAGLALGFILGRLQAQQSLSGAVKRLEGLSEAERSIREAAETFKGLEMKSATNACADFSHTAGLLMSLRRGDTNGAIETLETDLDMHVTAVALGLVDVPTEAQNRQFLSRVKWYRNYRAEHPHEDASTLTQHVLSLLSTNR